MPGHSLTLSDIQQAQQRLSNVITKTPLEYSPRLSRLFSATVYLKREDLQVVRSYKLRGAYNKIQGLTNKERDRGVTCASAGNHAQGVAHSCTLLQTHGTIFMPENTPRQKIARVKELGGSWVTIILEGDTFDRSKEAAITFATQHNHTFIHPFDDPAVIAGQATVGVEIREQLTSPPNVIIGPVGGGGLMSGVSFYTKHTSPDTYIIGAEPAGAASMQHALSTKKNEPLEYIDTFVDGAAVRQVGTLPLKLCSQYVDQFLSIEEGRVCTEMISLYQQEGIITEPAGALAVSALEQVALNIKNKTVVCIVSGGNNDLSRYPEIIERSLVHQGLKHYFLIEFAQRPGALRRYLDEALGPTDDITVFEYVKKNNREFGPALVGVELANTSDYEPLLQRMDGIGLTYQVVKNNSPLYHFLV